MQHGADSPLEIRDGVAHHRLFIDGTWVNSSHHSIIKDIDPSTGKLYAWVEQAGMEEIEQAIATAHRASKTWGSSLASE
jgi:acyl-CoA reductase-like NAD-dependent aldehyde dehydrogenase